MTQLIMQSICILFLLFSFFQVIQSQNYGTQQFSNDPYKRNNRIFNFNNILRNGLATGVSTFNTGSNILQLPLEAATNLFQYAPESASNQQPEQFNYTPYNSSPYNDNLNPIQQEINTATSSVNNMVGAGLTSGINALEAGASTLQLPLQAATNLFQYAPEGASNQQPEQYNYNQYNSSPYNDNLNPIQQGINTATTGVNNIMGAGLTSGINALGSGANILSQQLNKATNLVQNIPEFASNGIDFLQNIGQTGTNMANNAVKLSTAPIVAKLNEFGNVLGRFSSYSDPQMNSQNQIDQSNSIQVPNMNYENRY